MGLLSGCDEPEREEAPRVAKAQRSAPAAHGPLNLVLVTLDTTRADALSPYGQELPSSPRIEAMSQQGVLFEQVTSSSPSTLPSHATIFTGQYPFSHGVRANAGYRLSNQVLTLAEVLASRGYRTGAEVATTVLSASRGLHQGFEEYRDLHSHEVERIQVRDGDGREFLLNERPAADITRFGKRFIDAHAHERFFLWLHYFDPHQFYMQRSEYARQIPGDGYLQEVLYMDDQLGRLLGHLETRGLKERTLVVVVADHGEGMGEHGESNHSFFLYESTLRVPLLFWGPPSLPEGMRVLSPVRTVDIFPTVLDLMDLPVPPGLAGHSLRPLMERRGGKLDLAAYAESIEFASAFGSAPLRSLRRGPWKYIHQAEAELYRLDEDPGEVVNLAAQHPEKVAELRAELERLVGEAAPPADAGSTISAEERAQLEALGYTVGAQAVDEALLASLEIWGPSPAAMVEDVEILGAAGGRERLGDFQGAAERLEDLLTRHPNSVHLLSAYGRVLVAAGRRADARVALEQAIEAGGCAADARVELAALLRDLDDREEQRGVLEVGVSRCPEMPELLNNFAFLLATSPVDSLRDGRLALRMARRALEAQGGDPPEILDTLAAAQLEVGDFESAEATLQRALRAAKRLGHPSALTRMLEANLLLAQRGEKLRDR